MVSNHILFCLSFSGTSFSHFSPVNLCVGSTLKLRCCVLSDVLSITDIATACCCCQCIIIDYCFMQLQNQLCLLLLQKVYVIFMLNYFIVAGFLVTFCWKVLLFYVFVGTAVGLWA